MVHNALICFQLVLCIVINSYQKVDKWLCILVHVYISMSCSANVTIGTFCCHNWHLGDHKSPNLLVSILKCLFFQNKFLVRSQQFLEQYSYPPFFPPSSPLSPCLSPSPFLPLVPSSLSSLCPDSLPPPTFAPLLFLLPNSPSLSFTFPLSTFPCPSPSTSSFPLPLSSLLPPTLPIPANHSPLPPPPSLSHSPLPPSSFPSPLPSLPFPLSPFPLKGKRRGGVGEGRGRGREG